MPRSAAGTFAALTFLVLAAGCTQHYTIPKDKQPCADLCTQAQASCTSHCAENKGNPQVLEDVRGSLCEKRCKESYDDCMLKCL